MIGEDDMPKRRRPKEQNNSFMKVLKGFGKTPQYECEKRAKKFGDKDTTMKGKNYDNLYR